MVPHTSQTDKLLVVVPNKLIPLVSRGVSGTGVLCCDIVLIYCATLCHVVDVE